VFPGKYLLAGGWSLLLPIIVGPQAYAQDPGTLVNVEERMEINNGTNPTLLTTQAGIQYQHTDIGSGLHAGQFEAFYTQPFGDGDKAFRLTVPFANSPLESDLELGDVSFTYIDVFYLTEKNGAAFTAELFFDTAKRFDNGYGQYALETSVFYAFFLDDGSIFAPAWVQTFGLEHGNEFGIDVNVSTFDFYYVPKLANPNIYLTFDPAVIHDWENDDTFGSLQITFGLLTGKAFGGDSQVFVRPGVLFGGDRPADWSIQIGYKVLNF